MFNHGEDAIFRNAFTVSIPVDYEFSPTAKQAFLDSKSHSKRIAENLELFITFIDWLYVIAKYAILGGSLILTPGLPFAPLFFEAIIDLINKFIISNELGLPNIPTGIPDIVKDIIIDILQKASNHYKQLAKDPLTLIINK